jgi:hypothetical protein
MSHKEYGQSEPEEEWMAWKSAWDNRNGTTGSRSKQVAEELLLPVP